MKHSVYCSDAVNDTGNLLHSLVERYSSGFREEETSSEEWQDQFSEVVYKIGTR